jgi:flavin-dependent dehydrogenase
MGSLILHHLKERPLSHDGLIFCGDSASFVDCLTGEGISYALEAGGIIAPGVIEKAQNAGIIVRSVEKKKRLSLKFNGLSFPCSLFILAKFITCR